MLITSSNNGSAMPPFLPRRSPILGFGQLSLATLGLGELKRLARQGLSLRAQAHSKTRQGGVGGGDVGQTIHFHLLAQFENWMPSLMPNFSTDHWPNVLRIYFF